MTREDVCTSFYTLHVNTYLEEQTDVGSHPSQLLGKHGGPGGEGGDLKGGC